MSHRAKRSDFPWLGPDELYPFPDPESSTDEGIVGAGGNLSPGMLLSAYRQGIFPWFSDGDPILWWSPDPRFMLTPSEVHCSRRMARLMRQEAFSVTVDTVFGRVIRECARVPRPGQSGTWITDDMISGYEQLNELGYAHSCEAWADGELAGGLYGVSLGRAFFGESMFSHVANASKAAFLSLATMLEMHGFGLIDAQVHTPHLATLGARNVQRGEFLMRLKQTLSLPTIRGSWRELDRPAGGW